MIRSSFIRPTNMSWVLVENCACLQADAVCIRPEEYTKPVECLNSAHLGSFSDFLLSPPCNTNNNNTTINVTELVQQLNNANIAKATGCVNSMVFIFFIFIFMAQVCIFWAMFLNWPVRLPLPVRRRRSRPFPTVASESTGRPLTLLCCPREPQSPGSIVSENFGRRQLSVGRQVSTTVPRLATIEEADESPTSDK